jgi:hypothetical protein
MRALRPLTGEDFLDKKRGRRGGSSLYDLIAQVGATKGSLDLGAPRHCDADHTGPFSCPVFRLALPSLPMTVAELARTKLAEGERVN